MRRLSPPDMPVPALTPRRQTLPICQAWRRWRLQAPPESRPCATTWAAPGPRRRPRRPSRTSTRPQARCWRGSPSRGRADVEAAVRSAAEAQPAWRRCPGAAARPRRARPPRCPRRPSRRARRAGHRGHGQDARRRPRRGRPRDRVGGVGGRRAPPDEGPEPRGRSARDRRRAGAPAGRRRRRDHAVQLPGDDPALVPAQRDRHRQLVRAQALGARPAARPRGSSS